MLKRYDVTIEGDRIKWLGEKPNVQETRAIIIDVDSMTARREATKKNIDYWSWSP